MRVTDYAPDPAGRLGDCFTAADLAALDLPPLAFVVPGLLPEGLTLLAGKPKKGKSFLVLDWCLGIATGTEVMAGGPPGQPGGGGRPCEAGDVLYLALEDGPGRLQRRMRRLLGGRPCPDRLRFRTQAPMVGDGLEALIEAQFAEHPATRLVVIDTLACVRPKGGSGRVYDEDAASLKPLHRIAAARPGAALLVVHHLRKMDADDVFDTFSGSFGLTGVADMLLALTDAGGGALDDAGGRAGGRAGAKLTGQGRDAEGFELLLERVEATGGWRAAARQERDPADRLTGGQRLVLDALREAGGPLGTSEVAERTGGTVKGASRILNLLREAGFAVSPSHGHWEAK